MKNIPFDAVLKGEHKDIIFTSLSPVLQWIEVDKCYNISRITNLLIFIFKVN